MQGSSSDHVISDHPLLEQPAKMRAAAFSNVNITVGDNTAVGEISQVPATAVEKLDMQAAPDDKCPAQIRRAIGIYDQSCVIWNGL